MKLILFLALAAFPIVCSILALRSTLIRSSLTDILDDVRQGRMSLVTLYLVYGVLAIGGLVALTPPFQVPDENAHFLRADDVELGNAIGSRRDGRGGGVVDSGVAAMATVFYDVPFHPDAKVTQAMMDRAALSSWKETKVFTEFPNTAIYPPTFYTASALAIEVGKVGNLSVLSTLTLARLANGLVSLGLGALAIALAGGAGAWFFVLLMLPMTLAQTASVSQDAVLLPVAALAGALYLRLTEVDEVDGTALALLTALLALTATGRFPYATLAVLPLVLFRFGLRARLAAASAVVMATLGWMGSAAAFALVRFSPGDADVSAQLHYLASHPDAVANVLIGGFVHEGAVYLETFVGRLGWMDAPLPGWYVAASWGVIGLAALVCARFLDFRRPDVNIALVTLSAVILGGAALMMAFYLTWTGVGSSTVAGVQGRYFIPLAFFMPAVISAGPHRPSSFWERIGEAAVATFPLVTFPVVLASLVTRFFRG